MEITKSLTCFKGAAEQNDPIVSQFSLESMFKNKQGAIQDYIKAIIWYTPAGFNGNKNA